MSGNYNGSYTERKLELKIRVYITIPHPVTVSRFFSGITLYYLCRKYANFVQSRAQSQIHYTNKGKLLDSIRAIIFCLTTPCPPSYFSVVFNGICVAIFCLVYLYRCFLRLWLFMRLFTSFLNEIQTGWWNHLDTLLLRFGTRCLSLWENRKDSTFSNVIIKLTILWIDFIHSYSIIITYYFRLLFHLSVQLFLSSIVH